MSNKPIEVSEEIYPGCCYTEIIYEMEKWLKETKPEKGKKENEK
jgi:hypothetical protein